MITVTLHHALYIQRKYSQRSKNYLQLCGLDQAYATIQIISVLSLRVYRPKSASPGYSRGQMHGFSASTPVAKFVNHMVLD